jgi:hypothetical protein
VRRKPCHRAAERGVQSGRCRRRALFGDVIGIAQAVVFRFQQGPILGICNAAPIRVKHGSYRIPRGREPFSIAVRDAKGQIATLLEEGGVGANAFSITVRPGTGLTVTEELDADAHGTKPTIYYAFIRQGISCDKDTCRLDKKTCVLDLPKALYPDIVRQVEAHPEADDLQAAVAAPRPRSPQRPPSRH